MYRKERKFFFEKKKDENSGSNFLFGLAKWDTINLLITSNCVFFSHGLGFFSARLDQFCHFFLFSFLKPSLILLGLQRIGSKFRTGSRDSWNSSILLPLDLKVRRTFPKKKKSIRHTIRTFTFLPHDHFTTTNHFVIQLFHLI